MQGELGEEEVENSGLGAALTVTLILRKPPVPEFLSIMTLRLEGGVHSTRLYWISILPPSMGAICTTTDHHISSRIQYCNAVISQPYAGTRSKYCARQMRQISCILS